MRTPMKVVTGIVLGAGLFLAGYAANRHTAPGLSSNPATHAPAYRCPMHPQFTSKDPGECPTCGMRLERPPDAGGADVPGVVAVGAARQQLIGLRTDEVRRDASSHVLRVPGRIAVDDQRLYRIVAAADGWIVDLGQNTVGSFVRKNQLLASYYQKDLLYTERLFLLSVPAGDALPAQTKDFSQASLRTAGSANPQFPIDSLRGLGMSDLQIEEIHRTRRASPHINIYSPVSGFVLTRNVSPTQRFEKGTELYRIADLSRVWVMTDIFEKDRQFLKPGMQATIVYQGRRHAARMSAALPQFDAQSRTLKTRFELDNPDHLLQADMFVDVELVVEMPPAVTVPADAVFDSGLRRIVFVDRGEGNFEARRVEAGWRVGDRVEIVKGLMEGERIVAEATFLLDSESRMRAASQGVIESGTDDPICGMAVDEKRAAAAGRKVEHGGTTHYFCSDECKRRFEAEMAGGATPPKTAIPPNAHALAPATQATHAPAPAARATDPVCGMKVDLAEAKAAGLTSQHRGRTVPFCNESCKKAFDADPAKYEAQPDATGDGGSGHTQGDATARAQDPSGLGK